MLSLALVLAGCSGATGAAPAVDPPAEASTEDAVRTEATVPDAGGPAEDTWRAPLVEAAVEAPEAGGDVAEAGPGPVVCAAGGWAAPGAPGPQCPAGQACVHTCEGRCGAGETIVGFSSGTELVCCYPELHTDAGGVSCQ